MAKSFVILDDIDGTPEAMPVTFALEGQTYEIDLSEANIKKLHSALAPFISKARKTGRKNGTLVSDPTDKTELAEARAWLRSNGHDVKEKGRIAKTLMDEFRASK